MKTRNTEIIIEFTTTLSDLLHAAREWEARHWKVANRIVSILLVVLGIALLILKAPWFGSLSILLGVIEYFNLLPASWLRAIIEYRSNPKFKEKYHLTLTAKNLKFKTATIDSTLVWTHYNSFFETAKAFILVYGKRMYTVIPKRVLNSSEESEHSWTGADNRFTVNKVIMKRSSEFNTQYCCSESTFSADSLAG